MKSIPYLTGKLYQKGGNVLMQQVNIKFNNVEQAVKFVDIINKFEVNFDLGSGNRVVDAKSILGILALDLSEPLQLRYDSSDTRIIEKIAPFISKKPADQILFNV